MLAHLCWFFGSGQASNVPYWLGCLWAALATIIFCGSIGPGMQCIRELRGEQGPAPWAKKAALAGASAKAD